MTKEWKQPPVVTPQHNFWQCIYCVLVSKNHQKFWSGCLVHEFSFIYFFKDINHGKIFCGCFRSLWLWLLIALQLYRTSLMETVAENSNPIESKYERQKILVVILSNIFKVKQYKSLLEVEKIYCLIEIVTHIHQNNVLVYLGKVISVDVYYFYFTFFTHPINVTSLIPDNHILHIRIRIPNN